MGKATSVCSEHDYSSEFLECCRSGDFSTIVYLFQSESIKDINVGDESGLAIACRKNHFQIVNFLLRQDGLDVNKGITDTVDSYSDSGEEQTFIRHTTPLFIACEKNYFNIVELLLTNERIAINDGISLRDEEGGTIDTLRTPLTVSAERRHYEIVRLLLEEKNVDPSANDVYKVLQSASTLYYLCRDDTEESRDVLSLLLKHKDFKPRKDSMNPLFPAIENGNLEVVKELLMFSPISLFINSGLKGGNWGKTPLYLALEKSNFDIAKLLVEYKKTNLNGYKNFRPLHFSLEKGYTRIARMMLRKVNRNRIDCNIQCSKTQSTPLHLATKYNKLSIVKALLRNFDVSKSLYTKNGVNKVPRDYILRNSDVKKEYDRFDRKMEKRNKKNPELAKKQALSMLFGI